MLDALFVYIYDMLVMEIVEDEEEDSIPWEIY
jgi:hypothetical protein